MLSTKSLDDVLLLRRSGIDQLREFTFASSLFFLVSFNLYSCLFFKVRLTIFSSRGTGRNGCIKSKQAMEPTLCDLN